MLSWHSLHGCVTTSDCARLRPLQQSVVDEGCLALVRMTHGLWTHLGKLCKYAVLTGSWQRKGSLVGCLLAFFGLNVRTPLRVDVRS